MRQTIELVVMLCMGVMVVRTFAAEAYVVPTGSMAPTLLGWHRELICPNCQATFVVGIEDEGQSGEAVCANCGKHNLDDAPSIECGGDRVLVEKLIYEFRQPRRWEVAVFRFPGDPTQAYVKRVVGLPGERIRINSGDVYMNDQLARKSMAEIRAMRMLVHDGRFLPSDAALHPRWTFRSGAQESESASGWSRDGNRFVHVASAPTERSNVDWLVYQHRDPGRGGYGNITDFHSYNGREPRELNEINDIGVEARVTLTSSVEMLALELNSRFDRFQLRIPTARDGQIELLRNGRPLPISHRFNPLSQASSTPKTLIIEAALMDRRFQAAIDGQLLFEPYDYDDPLLTGAASESPIALGVRGGSAEVGELRVYRDIFYTGMLANTPRQPHGLRSGVLLGADEFFVLGDNSSVSNDSRFWSQGPVVHRSMFIGKPFLVHLPGELVPLKVFGRSFCWVPDPRRIRYIR